MLSNANAFLVKHFVLLSKLNLKWKVFTVPYKYIRVKLQINSNTKKKIQIYENKIKYVWVFNIIKHGVYLITGMLKYEN